MKRLFVTTVVIMTIGGFVCGIFYYLRNCREGRAARSVANAYARTNGLSTNVSMRNGHVAWDARGEFRRCCFVFEPRDDTIPNAILVRYTYQCPLNAFEVGQVPKASSYECNENVKLRDAEFRSAETTLIESRSNDRFFIKAAHVNKVVD